MRRLIAFFALCLLLLSACSPKSGEAEPTPIYPTRRPSASVPAVSATPQPTATPALPVQPPVWGEQTSDCTKTLDEDESVVLVQGEFSLPYIENAEGNKAYEAINLWYLNLSAGLRSDTLANAPMAGDDYAASKSMGYSFTPYTDEETYEITWESEGMVSILRTHYGLTGGVYPQILYLSDCFDLSTGERLSFADCFSDPEGAAQTALDEILRQAAQRPELSAEEVEGAFDRENFYLTEEAVVFFYQPEVLAPHAVGGCEFPVPRELLEGLLWE